MSGTLRLAVLVVFLGSLILIFPRHLSAGNQDAVGNSPPPAAGGNADNAIDPIRPISPIAAVPEPATAALVLGGGALMFWRNRKRKRRAILDASVRP